MNETQYQAICGRRQAFDSLVWQVPSLAIASQSFLTAAALNSETRSDLAVYLLVLSVVVGLASFQLMLKHRQLELEDSQRLQNFELEQVEAGYTQVHGSNLPVDGAPARNFLTRISSFRIWAAILLAFVSFSFYLLIGAPKI